mmetsp:Transcript_18739/g.43384  ORF Transcript_18739/g.43384 Transcript_18739/m.43384 type:complete len:133 (-) Transcript_18739:177-575(-)
MEMKAIIESRVSKIDKVTASDWHLSCVKLSIQNKHWTMVSDVIRGIVIRVIIVVGVRFSFKKESIRFPTSTKSLKHYGTRTSALKLPMVVVKVAIDMMVDSDSNEFRTFNLTDNECHLVRELFQNQTTPILR